jgi:hypothetical protein
MKICLISLSKNEMQIKTLLRFHLTAAILAIIKKTNNKYWQWCWGKRKLVSCWWKGKLVQSLWKSVWRLLKTLNRPTICPTIPLLNTYPKKCKLIYKKDTCILMFIAALFSIAKLLNQANNNQWMDKEKWSYICNRILLCHKEKWNFIIWWKMDGTGDHHTEICQAQKTKCCMLHVLTHLWKLDLKWLWRWWWLC